MPTFVFTDPNGRTHEVTGPEGATEAQAFQILQGKMGGAAAAPAQPAPHPTDDMGWGEKALVNLGAGFDTAWQGAKQLVGQGMSDDDLREKRRIDKELADRTTGGGLIQLAGEILPTVPLGLGAASGARAAGGIAARMAASPTLSAAGGGAASAALAPVTSDESRVTNMALGAAGGAVAPHALKLAMKAGRGAAQAGRFVASSLPGALGQRAAEGVGRGRTADLLRRELGDVPLPGQDAYTPHPFLTQEGVRPSAAVAMQDPRVAGLERGSRTSGGEHWMDFDQAGHRGRWNTIDDTLRTTDDVNDLIAEANKIGAKASDVYTAAGKRSFNNEMTDFYNLLQQSKNTAQYHGNPAVRSAVDYIEGTMAEAGQVTPELLHTMRRTVSKGLTGVPGAGEAGVRAASSEPFVISLADAMDRVLDTSTKGKFGRWKGDYAHKMGQAEGAKADVNIRNKFIDEATGTPRKPVAGLDDVPVMTGQALKNAIAAAGSMKRGPRKGQNILSTGSEDVLQGVSRDLDAGEIIQRSKKASTGGSGSDTASNLGQSALMEMVIPGAFLPRLIAGEGNRKGQQAMQRQLAQLLQDPQALRQFVAQQERLRLLRGQAPLLPGAGAAGMMLAGPD